MAKLINNIRFSHFVKYKCCEKRKWVCFVCENGFSRKILERLNQGSKSTYVDYVQTCSHYMQCKISKLTGFYFVFCCSQGHTNHGMDHANPDLPTLEKPTLDKAITDNCKEESHHLEI
jgi:hypothetical protein